MNATVHTIGDVSYIGCFLSDVFCLLLQILLGSCSFLLLSLLL